MGFYFGGWERYNIYMKTPDQDIKTILTLDQIEQQKKVLEQQQETLEEQPNKEVMVENLQNVTQDIDRKANIIEDTNTKIDAIRNVFGLEVSSEIPMSVEIEQKEINKLDHEKLSLEDKITAIENTAKVMTTNEGEKFSVITDPEVIAEYKRLKSERSKESGVDQNSQNDPDTEKIDEAKRQEQEENKKMEQKYMNEALEQVSYNLKRISSCFDDRQAQRFNAIFDDEDSFGPIANKLTENLDTEEVKNTLGRLGNIVEDFAGSRGSFMDDSDSLYTLGNAFRRLASSISEISSKIKDEEARKEFSGLSGSVADKVDYAASRIIRKAEAVANF